jgi:hypothetical protein
VPSKRLKEEIAEALERLSGNVNANSPILRSTTNIIKKSELVEKVLNKLEEMNPMNKKSFRDQGTKVQLSENLVFGGFPRTKLNEGEESESLSQTQQYAAAPPFDPHNRVFYPSQEFANLHGMYMKAIQAHNADPSEQNKQEVRRLFAVMRAHPHFEEHQENIRELERSRMERGGSQVGRSPSIPSDDPRLGIQGRSSIN